MACENCRQAGEPAFTLQVHVDRGSDGAGGRDEASGASAGERATVDLPFCSVECLREWTRPPGESSAPVSRAVEGQSWPA